jgi:hypothetical protein
MRIVPVILLALAPLAAQVARPVSATARVAAARETAPPRVSLVELAKVSRAFDRDLQVFAPADPVDVLGNTRGIYLEGFGAVFTTELSPIRTPGISPFRPNITDEEKAAVRRRKLERLPAVEKLMTAMLASTARELAALPDDQQIVLAVKFLYLPYEDTTGLPGQMVVKASRRAIASGAPMEATVTNQ